MTPTTLHPSVIRHRGAAPVAAAPADGAPFPTHRGGSVDGSVGGDGTYGEEGLRVPLWLVALVVGAILSVVTGALAGYIYGPDPDGAGASTGIAGTENLRPAALPTRSATTRPGPSGPSGATAGGIGAAGSEGSPAGSGGDAGTGTDQNAGAGPGTGAGSTGTGTGTPDTGSTATADAGEFSILSPGTGTRPAGQPITLEVSAVLPDDGGAVPDADIHWRLTRAPGGTTVYEHDGATVVVPGGLVTAGSYTATVHVASGGVVGSRHVSFTVAAGPTLTRAPALDLSTLRPTLAADPVAGRVVPVTDPMP